MSASKVLFFLCLSFVAGIFFESIVKIPQFFIWGFLFIAALLITVSFLSKRDVSAIAGFCLLFLIMGVLRVQIAEFNIANDKLAKLNGKGQVILTGIISGEPDVRETSQKIKVKVGNSTILLTTSKYPEYQYLDKIKITGKLEDPMVTDDFNYKNYLLKDGIYSVINFAKISVLGREKPNLAQLIYSKILLLKQRLGQSIQEISLPPQSLILEGIILGNNKNMTQDLRDKLANTGLRFLTAISGVHVIILSAILVSLLMFFGLGRIQAGGMSLILIWLYIAITGFTASGIRAGIMGSIFITAGVLGRQNTSARTIVLAASMMLLQNPLLLIYDAGFQLSFLASMGIINLKPIVDYFFKKIFKDKLREFSDILAATLSAQIFTLPIMIYSFGKIPLVSPITSILVLPVMPWILSFGFIFSIVGIVSKFLGFIFYIPCWILITYFLKVMDLFSQPWMVKAITNVSWIWVFVVYLVIAVVTWSANKKYSRNFL